MTIYRIPPEESIDLYPGLTVWESRVTGSITAGRSRLPLWAFVPAGIKEPGGYEPEEYGWTAENTSLFLYHLLNVRGEFARLLLVLADEERRERGKPWWLRRKRTQRVREQLERCLAGLGAGEAS